MLEVGAIWFAESKQSLEAAVQRFTVAQKADHQVSYFDWKWLDENLFDYFEGTVVSGTQLETTQTMLDEIETSFRLGMTHREMKERLQSLIRCWEAEIKGLSLVQVSPEHKPYYKPSKPLFGDAFATKFPSAAFDLSEAGQCLAFGRNTACVFHLMRLMEIGVRTVAKCLGMPDPVKPSERNWGNLLREINKGMQAKWPTAADRHGGDGAFFEELQASLEAVRNPWRNATMHVEKQYDAEQAEHIFVAVRGFWMKVAARMDENGLPLA